MISFEISFEYAIPLANCHRNPISIRSLYKTDFIVIENISGIEKSNLSLQEDLMMLISNFFCLVVDSYCVSFAVVYCVFSVHEGSFSCLNIIQFFSFSSTLANLTSKWRLTLYVLEIERNGKLVITWDWEITYIVIVTDLIVSFRNL